MVSTVSHVYLTVAAPSTLYTAWGANTMGSAKVAVSFPIWAYGAATLINDASVAPNLVKITVAAENPN